MTSQTFNLGDNVTVKIDRHRGMVNATAFNGLPDGSDLHRVEFPDRDEAWFDPRYLEMTDASVNPMPDEDRLAA